MSRALLTPCFATLLAAACGGPGPSADETGILVAVDADPMVRARTARLGLTVWGRAGVGGWTVREERLLEASDPLAWPRFVAVAPKGGDPSRLLRVQAEVYEEGSDLPLVVSRAETGFVGGSWRRLQMTLLSTCFGVSCPEEESCREDGRCAPARRDPRTLPEVVPDAPGRCERDADCDDGAPCTVDRCVLGTCVSAAPPGGALGFREVSAGAEHTCAIDALGRPWCWGLAGPWLGQGALEGPVLEPARAALPEGVSLRALAAGRTITLAVDAEGGLWAWGANTRTNPGYSPNCLPDAVPRVFDLGGPWRGVRARGAHLCLLPETGPPRCRVPGFGVAGCVFGSDGGGWVELAGGPAALLALGPGHGCARGPDGVVRCWGTGRLGRLGFEDEADAPPDAPREVPALRGAVALALGAAHGCALDERGTPRCWGADETEQLGDGPGTANAAGRSWRGEPAPVVGFGRAVALAAGRFHTCALDAEGRGWCWGAGPAGQLGGGEREDAPSPVAVRGPGAPLVRFAAGDGHTCAIDELARLWCWGSNASGQLGVGDRRDRLVPTRVGEGLRCP